MYSEPHIDNRALKWSSKWQWSDEIPQLGRLSLSPAKLLLMLGNFWLHKVNRHKPLVLRNGGDLNLLSIPVDVGQCMQSHGSSLIACASYE